MRISKKKILFFFKKPKAKKGIAIIEFMLMFFVYVFLLAVLYGSWGIVHSGILNSIGARQAAFSQIAHRSDLSFYYTAGDRNKILENSYFLGDPPRGKKAVRVFGIHDGTTSGNGEADWKPLNLRMDVGGDWNNSEAEGIVGFDRGTSVEDFSGNLWPEGLKLGSGSTFEERRNPNLKTSQVRLKQAYGICLDFNCGDD